MSIEQVCAVIQEQIDQYGEAHLDFEGFSVMIEPLPEQSYLALVFVTVDEDEEEVVIVGDEIAGSLPELMIYVEKSLQNVPFDQADEIATLARQLDYKGASVEALWALSKTL